MLGEESPSDPSFDGWSLLPSSLEPPLLESVLLTVGYDIDENLNNWDHLWIRTGRFLHRRVLLFARREMLLWLERWTWSWCRNAASAKTERAARKTKVERNFIAMCKKECRWKVVVKGGKEAIYFLFA